jgi:hypothetical protein
MKNKKTGISGYLDELEEKIRRDHENPEDNPKIGIFWLCIKDSKISIFLSVRLSLIFGQQYGFFIVSSYDHYSTWESFKRFNMMPKNSNYEDLPRGRISYNINNNQYVVYHGNYIKSSSGIKSVIKKEFDLKRNTRWEPDLHYHKFKRWGF